MDILNFVSGSLLLRSTGFYNRLENCILVYCMLMHADRPDVTRCYTEQLIYHRTSYKANTLSEAELKDI